MLLLVGVVVVLVVVVVVVAALQVVADDEGADDDISVWQLGAILLIYVKSYNTGTFQNHVALEVHRKFSCVG